MAEQVITVQLAIERARSDAEAVCRYSLVEGRKQGESGQHDQCEKMLALLERARRCAANLTVIVTGGRKL